MRPTVFYSYIVFLIVLSSCAFKTPDPLVQDKMHIFLDSLINEMTVEEKAGQLTLYTSGWTITGPQLREDYLDELKAGRAGN